jgi:hypothetical protein
MDPKAVPAKNRTNPIYVTGRILYLNLQYPIPLLGFQNDSIFGTHYWAAIF